MYCLLKRGVAVHPKVSSTYIFLRLLFFEARTKLVDVVIGDRRWLERRWPLIVADIIDQAC
ncbi:unnamed protein product [Prunus brigantina]